MKKYLIPVLLLSFISFASIAYAAPSFIYQRTILPETTSTYELGTTTKKWLRLFSDYASTTAITISSLAGSGTKCVQVDNNGFLTISADACGSGTGGGNVATSSQETATYIPFWTSTNATPATLSGGNSTFTWNNTVGRLIFPYATTTYITASTASTTNLRVSSSAVFEHLGTGLAKITSGVLGLATAGVDYLASYDAWTHPSAGVSATTSQIRMAGFISTASSTVDGNLNITGNATATNATTTNSLYTQTLKVNSADGQLGLYVTAQGSNPGNPVYVTNQFGTELFVTDKNGITTFDTLQVPNANGNNNYLGGYIANSDAKTTLQTGVAGRAPIGTLDIYNNTTPQIAFQKYTIEGGGDRYRISGYYTDWINNTAAARTGKLKLTINDFNAERTVLNASTTGSALYIGLAEDQFKFSSNGTSTIPYASSTAVSISGSGASFVVTNAGANIGLATSTQPSSKVELGGTQVTSGGDNGTGQFLNLSGLLNFSSNSDTGSLIKLQPTVTNSGSSNIFFGVNVDPRTITNTSQISTYASFRAAEETTNTFGTSSIGYLYGNAPSELTDYGLYINSADNNYLGTGSLGLGTSTPLSFLTTYKSQSGLTTIGNARVVALLNSSGSANQLQEIGFGFQSVASNHSQPVVIGHRVTSGSANSMGDFYIATRAVTTDTFPTERLTVTAAGNVGIGTTTPQWLLNPFSATAPQLSLSAGAGIAQWTMRNAGGNLYFATTTVAGNATTSTSALTLFGSGVPSLQIGSTTPQNTLKNGSLVLGGGGDSAGITGSTTIQMAKIQIDGQNTTGGRVCLFIVGTTPTVSSGACNP